MKVRLNFVRAFLNKPKIVFLDEPTAGLDPVNAKKIKDIILAKKAYGNGTKTKDFDLASLGKKAGFLSLIKEKYIETIPSQEATLEDIFIETTGRSLI